MAGLGWPRSGDGEAGGERRGALVPATLTFQSVRWRGAFRVT